MAKVVWYRRISVSRVESESMESQRQRLLAWTVREGHELIGDYSEELSGKSIETRPGAVAAIAMACRYRGSILAVASLSRLLRFHI
jgi:hypothetical protein